MVYMEMDDDRKSTPIGEGCDSPFLDYCNPQYVKGSIIPYSHQPTRVLSTAHLNLCQWIGGKK